ncbi:hypothetical protein KR222_010547, partial [Zaprionus bogoriensis]
KSWPFFWYTLLPLLLVACISCCITLYQNGDAVSNFMQRYSSQYQAVVHNKLNYCDRSLPLSDVFARLHENVLNQEAALDQLERAMTGPSSFQSIALVGSSGVGKSLTMRLLLEQFPWAENVHSIAWNDYELADEQARYQAVDDMLQSLAHCGRNLFIIDNMATSDAEYVATINEMILSRSDVAKDSSDLAIKQLTIIYVFNLNRMIANDLYERQVQLLQQLPETTVITYREFGQSDLERCVRHEAKLVDLDLEERYVQEMLKTTDVQVSGCKSVRAKVIVYGKP